MKKKLPFTPFALAALLLIFSCSGKSNSNSKAQVTDMAGGAPSMEVAATSQSADSKVVVPDRKLIKEGDISFKTSDVKSSKELILQAVKAYEGYMSQDIVNDFPDKIEHSVVIRVRSDRFDALLDKISSSVERLETKNINVSDVSEEFVDVEARIKTKKELEQRYEELLKRATKVEEMLTIEREIGNLRAEIESMEGRLNYIKDRVAFSTLKVTYYQRINSSYGLSSKFGQAIVNGWNNLMSFLVGITAIWPFAVICGIVVFFILRRKRRNAIPKQNK